MIQFNAKTSNNILLISILALTTYVTSSNILAISLNFNNKNLNVLAIFMFALSSKFRCYKWLIVSYLYLPCEIYSCYILIRFFKLFFNQKVLPNMQTINMQLRTIIKHKSERKEIYWLVEILKDLINSKKQ